METVFDDLALICDCRIGNFPKQNNSEITEKRRVPCDSRLTFQEMRNDQLKEFTSILRIEILSEPFRNVTNLCTG